MNHHSSDKSLTDRLDAMRSVIENAESQPAEFEMRKQLASELGPTNEYPDGKIVPHDEGGLMFGVTVFNGRVIFDFGKPIRSIGFTREGALELAELIKRRAEQCSAILFPKEPKRSA